MLQKFINEKLTNVFCFHHQEVTTLTVCHVTPPDVSLMTIQADVHIFEGFIFCFYRDGIMLFIIVCNSHTSLCTYRLNSFFLITA